MAGDRPYQRQSFWPMKDLLEPNQPLSPANDQLLGEIIKQPVLIDAIFHRSSLRFWQSLPTAYEV